MCTPENDAGDDFVSDWPHQPSVVGEHPPLHRLLHLPPPAGPSQHRLHRPLPTHSARLALGMAARTSRAPLPPRRMDAPSPTVVPVSSLGGARLSRHRTPADRHLVAPLFDPTSERPRSSSVERTLYGPEEDEEPENPFAPPHLPETTISE